jgi:glycine cleavage system H protein
MSRQKPFTDALWYEKADNIITVGVTEDLATSIESIEAIELPLEGDPVDIDTIVGTLETDQGTIDIYSPVNGVISEINDLVLEDPSLIVEDPSENWLFKVESEENPEDNFDSDEYEDEDDYEEDEDENFDEDEEEEE